MTQLFLSYARPNADSAQRVAATLRARGYEVWLDDELPAHRAYDEVIQERLQSASAVLVLWSEAAVKSQWVRAEADAARGAGKLVQARLEDLVPPIPFNLIQCADLSHWSGDPGEERWRKVETSIGELAGASGRGVEAKPRPAKLRSTSICVLPFQNMSGDPEQDYFSDGISEDITTDLSKISALAVTARNTAFSFKGKPQDISELAKSLRVSHVLEGSVRKAGGRVRVTAQLIDGATGDHVWAERYDRDLTNIFAIQDEISKAIVGALRLKLLPHEKRALEQRGTNSVEAYNLYLMARQFWITGNYGDIRRDQIVIRTAKHAVELDPNYARALALVAIAKAALRYHHGIGGEDGSAEAERALVLDPGIAEAYCVKARHLAEGDDYESAFAEIAKGLMLDPDSWEVNREAARLCMQKRRIAEATAHFRKAADLMEADFHSCVMLATCYEAQGDTALAREAARMMVERTEAVIARDPLNASALGINADGLAMLGELDRAKERFQRAIIIDPDNVNMPYNFACVLASWVGDIEGALDLIEPMFERVSRSLLITSLADPDMDNLRDHPRFRRAAAAAMERTGVRKEVVPSRG